MKHQLPADVKFANRKCLGPKCGRTFRSAGPGIRLCPSCRKKRDAGKLDGFGVRAGYVSRGEGVGASHMN